MKYLNNLADIRYRVAEIWQISGNRQTQSSQVCRMLPAKFLSSAQCSPLNISEGVA